MCPSIAGHRPPPIHAIFPFPSYTPPMATERTKMASFQTTLPFKVRKKTSLNFYSSKLDSDEAKITVDVPVKKEHQPSVYVAKVKKLVELDSGDENVDFSNLCKNASKSRKRTYKSKRGHRSEESSDEECSPTKISRMIKNDNLKKQQSSPSKRKSISNTKIQSSDSEEDKDLHHARIALHSTTSKSLPGREVELKKLESFLADHLDNEKSGTLYVSGPPGTGKTACISNILQRPKFQKGCRCVYLNCTSVKSAGGVFNRICEELRLKTSGSNEKSYLRAIEKHLASKHTMIVLVLDEIDQLCNKKQSVLYTIFEWPSLPKSNIVLIGIANALDLTDRILPRLHTKKELKPELMHFAPYTKQQIIEIFTERLKEEVALDFFSPTAIQMLAGKVAAICGDIRRALDIGRRVVELASPRTPSQNKTAKGASVELKQVMCVLNDVYGASQKLETDVDESFPLQQKLLVCSLLLILNKGKNKDVTVGKLHDVYKRVCFKRNIVPVDSAEFFGLCGLVETRGIIRLSGKKEPRMHKVALQWDESEVSNALRDKQMISDILNDVSCLS